MANHASSIISLYEHLIYFPLIILFKHNFACNFVSYSCHIIISLWYIENQVEVVDGFLCL